MDKIPLFIAAPFFMVRTPCLPIEVFFELLKHDDFTSTLFSYCENNEKILEAVAVASPSLLAAFKERDKKTAKEKKQIANSLFKYVSRMSSRPTPFGLFSFVSTGKWESAPQSLFNLDQVQKRARPDMEWLESYIHTLCSSDLILSELPVQVNPLIHQSGEIVSLSYFRKRKLEEEIENKTLRNSTLVQSILEFAEMAISVKYLEEKVLEKHPALIHEKVLQVIQTLIHEQFLIPALSPSLLSLSPFSDFTSRIASLLPLKEEHLICQNLAEKIADYNRLPFGKGEAPLSSLQNEMSLRVPSASSILQVDAYSQGNEISLPLPLMSELSEVVEIFWKLSSYTQKYHSINAYYQEFINRYGCNRLVPLFELLSEEEGLGIPENYKNNQKLTDLPDSRTEWIKWLKQELASSLFEGKNEIVITEEIIKELIKEKSPLKAPRSFEITFEIISQSAEHVNKGDYDLFCSYFSWQGGSTFGRFVDILGENLTEKLKDFFSQEETLETAIFAESSFMPSNSRQANVAIHPRLRKYAIDLENSREQDNLISLQDILVGATESRLYLTLKGTQKELIVTAGDVLNSLYAPIPLRLIRDISQMRYDQILPFSWNHFNDFPFLPRIRYKKAVLVPAQWKLNLSSLRSKNSKEEIEQKLKAWFNRWKTPRYVFLTEGDNRILLDTHHSAHLNEISRHLLKGREIKLVEKLGQEKGEWIQSRNGFHLSEFVVPFLKNGKYSNNDNISIPKYVSMPIANRWKTPGTEWLFAKIYLSQTNENRFIVQHLMKFIESSFQKKLFDEWFYIRYKDPNSHLRIRFKGNPEILTSSFIPHFNQWIQLLMQGKLINNIQFASYEREIERYGGSDIIELAESFFCLDSITSINILSRLFENNFNIPHYIVAVISILDLLQGFGIKTEDQMALLEVKEKQVLEGFREWKPFLAMIGKAICKNELSSLENENMHHLTPIFLNRKQFQSHFSNRLNDLNDTSSLSNPPYQIINSLIHLHCNRLMGCDLTLEKKARLYAQQALRSIQHEF